MACQACIVTKKDMMIAPGYTDGAYEEIMSQLSTGVILNNPTSRQMADQVMGASGSVCAGCKGTFGCVYGYTNNSMYCCHKCYLKNR